MASIRIPSRSCSSSIPALCITPRQGTTSSSKEAVIPIAGWIERPRPTRGWPPSPLRRSSGGVGIAPAATITIGAEIRTSVPSARRASTPIARPPSISTRFTCRPETILAPASQACGSAFRWTPPLALLGQPIAHWQAPRQPGALRRSGAPAQPRAAAPCRANLPLRPSTSSGAGATPIVSSTSASRASSDSGSASARPSRSNHDVATGRGGRKQVPELITVVPPTARPIGSAIGGLPRAIVVPPSR